MRVNIIESLIILVFSVLYFLLRLVAGNQSEAIFTGIALPILVLGIRRLAGHGSLRGIARWYREHPIKASWPLIIIFIAYGMTFLGGAKPTLEIFLDMVFAFAFLTFFSACGTRWSDRKNRSRVPL